jgi:phage terminase small subunit
VAGCRAIVVDDEGYIVPGSKKQPTGHPAIGLAHDIDRQMTVLEVVLALHPESRSAAAAIGCGDGRAVHRLAARLSDVCRSDLTDHD